MAKQLISNYTINNTAKTITLTDFTTLVKERLLLITNTTTQATVYQFNTTTGVTVSGNVITFTGTFAPANTDSLQIYYDTKQGDPHYDDWQLLADVASNQVIGSGSITAADAASTTGSGQASQVLITGTPTAGSAYALLIPIVNGTSESLSSIVINITGTFVGTYQFERSPDNGTTWTPFSPFVAGQAQTTATGTLPGMFHGNVAGVTNVRVRCTAYTSGTINVRFSMGTGIGTITVGNPIRLYDGVNNTQATIKPASTAPAATDTALVFSKSPNSPDITTLNTIATNTTGAATAANQTNGSQQVQGNVAASATDSGNPIKVGGKYNSTLPTLTSGQRGDIQLDAASRVYVQAPTATGAAIPTNAFLMGASNAENGNLTTIGTLRPNFGDGFGATTQALINLNTIWNGGSLDRVRSATNAVAAGTGIPGVALVPTATGLGLTSFQNTAVAATAVSVKASAGRLHRITIQNPNTSIAWLQIFNATAPTVGTTTPVMSIPIPASGIFEDFYPISDTFSTAITIAATTTATGSTANTTALFVSLGYI